MRKKEKTKQEILAAAESLFYEKGIRNTGMEMIAKSCSCHRRTLYRYFPQKEDLIYEVAILLMERLNFFQEKIFETLKGNGIEKLSTFLLLLTAHMEKKSQIVRLLAEYDFLFNDQSHYSPTPENEKRFNKTAHLTETILEKIISEGITDSSISTVHSTETLVQTISAGLWSLAQRLAMRGKILDKEFGNPGIKWIKCQIELYIEAISTQQETK